MPELPEVETVRTILEQALVGKKILDVNLRRASLRFPFPKNFAAALTGQHITSVQRRAKYLLFFLENKKVLIAHLGMSGSFRIFRKHQVSTERHDHVIFSINSDTCLLYNDPRRFGFMDITSSESITSYPKFLNLGPEPLSDHFDFKQLLKALAARKGPIKPILLDQKLVAGIGNIYACEALFRARLSPRRSAFRISERTARYLVQAIKDVLRDAIEAGGSTLRNYQDPSGKMGYFQANFAVYGRDGLSCPNCSCFTGIKKITQSGRSTFFCSKYQK